jgi:hypothetical protein
MMDVNDRRVNENRRLKILKSIESPLERGLRIGDTLE